MRPKSCALQLRISPSRSSRNAWSRNTGHCGCSWTHRILATAGWGGKEPSFSFSIVKLASYLDWFRTRLFVKFLFPWEKNNSSASYRTRFAQSQPNPIHQWQACKVSLWHFWCFQANLPGNQEGGQDHTCRLHGVRATSTAAGHDELRQLETHSSSTRHLLCLIVVVLPLHLTINLKGYYECARSGSTGFNGVQWASLGFPLPQPWFSHIQRMLHNFPGANLLPFCFFIPWVFDAFVSLNCKRFHCKMANIYMFFVSFLLQYLFWISFFIKHFHGVHSWAEDKTNIWYLLNRREQQLVRQLDLSFLIQYGMNPCFFENLFFFLGDRFEWCKSWSAHSGVLPCFRKNGAKYIQRSTMKAMTAQDKLSSLGWPVTPGCAKQMGTTEMPILDPRRASQMAGNSMHLSVAGIVLLVGMCCYTKKWVNQVPVQLIYLNFQPGNLCSYQK